MRDKSFEIASNPKYNGYQRGLESMVYKVFDKKPGGGGLNSMPSYHLTKELHKQAIGKFKRRKVYSSFIDNELIWELI